MKQKLIAWLLIILGGIPVLAKIIIRILNSENYFIELENENLVNFINKNGTGIVVASFFIGLVMITIGFMMLKKQKAASVSLHDEHDLNEGERIIIKQSGSSSIVTVTNHRVRYYGFFTKELRKSVKNVPDSDREDYPVTGIKSVRAVITSDLMKIRFGGSAKWGIQMVLKDGRIVNIPVSEQDAVANHIDILIKQS